MNVRWTIAALDNLDSIHDYIAQVSEDHADRVIRKIALRAKQLSDFPLSGRVVPEFAQEQIRELIEGNYRLIYYIKPDGIEIFTVIHTKISLDEA